MDVISALEQRHSVRGFLSKPVESELLTEVFSAAQRAPSWCNIQLWRVWVTSGDTTRQLAEALCKGLDEGTPHPQIPFPVEYPEPYGTHRRQCGATLYGAMGIERSDRAARDEAFRRNYRAFDAPHIAMVCYDAHFGVYGALDVGCYLQSVMLAAQARGLATCPMAALANYPTHTRSVLPIPEQLTILCGIAIGYEDEDVPANKARMSRADLSENVTFL